MGNVITNIAPTTELEAVNSMLSAIGETQLPAGTDLAGSLGADAALAVDLLRKSTREMLSLGWRFNREDGVELAPASTFVWTDSTGTSTTLNIFKLPSGLLKWEQTECQQNDGLDLIERRSKAYTEGNPAAPAMVLYDRAKNRDGVDSAKYPHIYVDTFSAVDFEDMPESARRYAATRAGRQFAQQALGSDQLAGFAEKDEMYALRTLKRDHGLTKKLNILDNAGIRDAFGRRPTPRSGAWERVYPGHS